MQTSITTMNGPLITPRSPEGLIYFMQLVVSAVALMQPVHMFLAPRNHVVCAGLPKRCVVILEGSIAQERYMGKNSPEIWIS